MNTNDEHFSVTCEATPNPRSRKVIFSQPLHQGKAAVYCRETGAFEGGAFIEALLALEHITDLYLRDNVLTVTQDGTGSWYLIEDQIAAIVQRYIDLHDPTYVPPDPATLAAVSDVPRPTVKSSPQLDVIREILDATITPYIASHGGAIELIEFNTETHRLTIYYDGSCGTCPSSLGMTLAAIQNMLRDQYDPQITVAVANPATPGPYDSPW